MRNLDAAVVAFMILFGFTSYSGVSYVVPNIYNAIVKRVEKDPEVVEARKMPPYQGIPDEDGLLVLAVSAAGGGISHLLSSRARRRYQW